ncbi:hypothetical protein [Symbiopectobacterium sp.]|uniref:hypothetical protein n=1 Tax=Symbiopectobacterium sp. TaxID=2952789 RepID=UPI003F2EA647
MEETSNSITNRRDLQSRFVVKTLNSWRFFLLLSVPPLVWAIFTTPPGVICFVIVFLTGIVWLGCWRLWLDVQYFTLINQENDAQVGAILFFIWQRERLQALSLVERQQGVLWIIWLIALLLH